MQTTYSVLEPARSNAAPAAGYRYGAVLLLTVTMLVVLIAAPATEWTRAATLTLQLSVLLVTIATSRARTEIRRARALALAIPGVLLVVAVGTGALPVLWALLITAVLAVALPAVLVGGIVRLVRGRGVSREAVAGALAIYVLVGLVFTMVIAVLAHTGAGPYFAQGTDGTTGERTYFSFATLTTTGYGDFTPAGSAGRALAVVEMLTGQIYLVTVIGVLVGNLASRARSQA